MALIANIIGLCELVIAHLLRMSLWGSCQPQFRPHLNWVSENSEANQREQVWQTDSWLVMPTAEFIANQFTRSIFISRRALLHTHGTWYLTLISALKKSVFFKLSEWSSWTRFQTNKAFFQPKPSSGRLSAGAKRTQASQTYALLCSEIKMRLFDCSEIYEKTSKKIWEVVNPDHTTLKQKKAPRVSSKCLISLGFFSGR